MLPQIPSRLRRGTLLHRSFTSICSISSGESDWNTPIQLYLCPPIAMLIITVSGNVNYRYVSSQQLQITTLPDHQCATAATTESGSRVTSQNCVSELAPCTRTQHQQQQCRSDCMCVRSFYFAHLSARWESPWWTSKKVYCSTYNCIFKEFSLGDITLLSFSLPSFSSPPHFPFSSLLNPFLLQPLP